MELELFFSNAYPLFSSFLFRFSSKIAFVRIAAERFDWLARLALDLGGTAAAAGTDPAADDCCSTDGGSQNLSEDFASDIDYTAVAAANIGGSWGRLRHRRQCTPLEGALEAVATDGLRPQSFGLDPPPAAVVVGFGGVD
jgi:hypothetical protein